jgi:molecular chaperone GrpE
MADDQSLPREPYFPDDQSEPASPPGADEKALDGKLHEQLAEAQAKAAEHRDAWLRALADAENARKRAQADLANAHKFAVEKFADALLPVIDSLEAALATQAGSVEALKSGVELTAKQLRAAFEKSGITEIAPPPGTKFDPHRHQAMATVESDAEPNSIVTVLQKGWSLNDRVLRPALVTVSKPRADGAANDAK